jgi:malonyl-CoA O-methyltransferase
MTLMLDKAKVRRSFAAASITYDQVAGLQRQVGLDLMMLHPLTGRGGKLLDLGCGTGFLTGLLMQEKRHQSVMALDVALPMLIHAQDKLANTDVSYLCADAESLPLQSSAITQIYSNLALQWCQGLRATLKDLYRVLEAEGKLVFSTFGPATLNELKSAWASVDDYSHVNDFFSINQVQDYLQEAGFHNISTHSDIYKIHYDSVMALMQELKSIGAHNVTVGRNKKLTSRAQLGRMIKAYPLNAENEIVASYEIIFVAADKL